MDDYREYRCFWVNHTIGHYANSWSEYPDNYKDICEQYGLEFGSEESKFIDALFK